MSAASDNAGNGTLSPSIRSILDAAGDGFSCLMVSAGEMAAAELDGWNDLDRVVVRECDRLDRLAGKRFDLAVVAEFPEGCREASAASALLAKLRDRYAARVIIVDDAGILALADYLALGFEGWDTDGESRCFTYDPNSRSLKREWNDARHWANPENFDKYRW